MRLAPLAALLLLPALASGSAFEELAAFRPPLAALRAAHREQRAFQAQQVQAQAAVQEIPGVRVFVPLPALVNNIRRGAITTYLDGRRVRVFGNKSQNTKEWFIGFITDDGAVRLFKGKKALYLDSKVLGAIAGLFGPSMDNHLILEFYGRLYDVQIIGNAGDRMQSQIAFTPSRLKPGRALRPDRRPEFSDVEHAGERRTIGSIQQLIDLGERAAHPVPLGGVEYRLFYGEGFVEDKHGEYGGPSGDLSVAVIFRDRHGKSAGFHWFVKDISRERLVVSRPFIRGGVDNCRVGPTFGLMLMSDGQLDMRLLAPQPDYAALEREGRAPAPSPVCLSAPKAD